MSPNSHLPQQTLGSARIFHHFGGDVEAHGRSARQIVARPARITVFSERNPRGLHGIGNLLGWIGAQKSLHVT